MAIEYVTRDILDSSNRIILFVTNTSNRSKSALAKRIDKMYSLPPILTESPTSIGDFSLWAYKADRIIIAVYLLHGAGGVWANSPQQVLERLESALKSYITYYGYQTPPHISKADLEATGVLWKDVVGVINKCSKRKWVKKWFVCP